MMVFLAVVLVLIAAIAVALWQKVRISYELKLENFKISFKAKISVFGKMLFDSETKKEKTAEDEPKPELVAEEKQKRKMKLSDITAVKNAAKAVLPVILRLITGSVGFERFETDVRVALPDPMDTGIAYGIVCGAMNNLYAVIMRKHPKKEYFLDIEYDFKSGEGLILENKGTLYIRPGRVLGIAAAAWIGNKSLRKAVKDIKNLFTKEENVK